MADYYYALGRRKTASATVRLYPGTGESTVNGKALKEVFALANQQQKLDLPFKLTSTEGKYYFTAKTAGGGTTGQLEAIMLGISRALVKVDETFKPFLKQRNLLTRDDRMVERKKTGLVKARKAPQFSKR